MLPPSALLTVDSFPFEIDLIVYDRLNISYLKRNPQLANGGANTLSGRGVFYLIIGKAFVLASCS